MSSIQSTSSSSYAIQWQYMQAMQQSGTDPLAQSSAGDAASFDPLANLGGLPQPSGSPAGPPFSLDAMSALISAQEQSGTTGLSAQQQKVFGELDTDGDGSVSKAELETDFGANNKDIADYVMGKLDTNGDGSISQDEFAAGTTRGTGGHHHHHMHAAPPDGTQGAQDAQGTQSADGAQDPLSQLLSADGANSDTTSNSDGTTTTTITYADGSKVSMTSAVPQTATDGGDANSVQKQTQANLLQQLIKMQAQLTQSASASTSVATV